MRIDERVRERLIEMSKMMMMVRMMQRKGINNRWEKCIELKFHSVDSRRWNWLSKYRHEEKDDDKDNDDGDGER